MKSRNYALVILIISLLGTHEILPSQRSWFTEKMSAFFATCSQNRAFTLAVSTLATAGLYGIYKWITTPATPTPTLENIKAMTLIRNEDDLRKIDHIPGIPALIKDKEVVTIFVPGYNCSGRRGAQIFMTMGAIPSYAENKLYPCITFNFIDSRRALNLGQALDQACLDLVYKEIVRINPRAQVIIVGLCRGALTALNLLANKPKESYTNLKALILLEPLTPEVHQVSTTHSWATSFMPNYNKRSRSILEASSFPQEIPILIASTSHDMMASKTKEIVTRLAQLRTSNDLYFYESTVKKRKHGFIINEDELAYTLNTFYKKYELPHSITLENAMCPNCYNGPELLKKYAL